MNAKKMGGALVLLLILTGPVPSTAQHEPRFAATLRITTTSMPNAVRGVPYSAQLYATGGRGTYQWSLQPGSSLPRGLTLSRSGRVSGTPTSTGPVRFTVRCESN